MLYTIREDRELTSKIRKKTLFYGGKEAFKSHGICMMCFSPITVNKFVHLSATLYGMVVKGPNFRVRQAYGQELSWPHMNCLVFDNLLDFWNSQFLIY